MEKDENNVHKGKKWAKHLGLAGFLFFTIKGLLWIIVPTVLFWFGIVTK